MSATAWILVESYMDSAARSYLAAMILEDAGDHSTSGHLYGVAAECAVKYFLEAGGVSIDRSLKVHFPNLTDAISLHGQGRTMIPLLGMLQGPPDILSNYSIHSRYAQDNCVSEAICLEWKAGTQQIFTFCGLAT